MAHRPVPVSSRLSSRCLKSSFDFPEILVIVSALSLSSTTERQLSLSLSLSLPDKTLTEHAHPVLDINLRTLQLCEQADPRHNRLPTSK